MAIDWNQLYIDGRDYSPMNLFHLDRILAATSETAGKAVLDIGCGTGDLSVKLAQRGYTVTGIDMAPAAVAKAKERSAAAGVSEHTMFEALDIAALPQRFDGMKFDLITCKAVYAFIADQPAFLAFVADHLATNGSFVLISPVLHPDVEYSPRLNSISVPLASLQTQLETAFKVVQDIHHNCFEEQGEEHTFVAANA